VARADVLCRSGVSAGSPESDKAVSEAWMILVAMLGGGLIGYAIGWLVGYTQRGVDERDLRRWMRSGRTP
jgi:NhaP-type Na+/H+ or K+/H+ antiporter